MRVGPDDRQGDVSGGEEPPAMGGRKRTVLGDRVQLVPRHADREAPPHNVFLSGDYEEAGQALRVSDFLPPEHNFAPQPGVHGPTCAPEGGSSVMILLPVANINEQARMQETPARPHRGGDGERGRLCAGSRKPATRRPHIKHETSPRRGGGTVQHQTCGRCSGCRTA